ncbi:MAG: HEAT repeat domain-containing protein [Anaerolineales bacterium]|nr:MAG: HEAT repeat domain-containing protein [Anaerolineales bacterium]
MSQNQPPGMGNPRASASAGEFERLLFELRDFNDGVREKAAIRLGEIGNKNAIQPLIGRLNNDKSPRVQWYAADALYKLGDAQAWPAIKDRLNAGGDALVRAKCAEILGLSGDKFFSDTLVDALRNGGDIANIAAVGLGRLKNLDVLAKLINIIDTSRGSEELKNFSVIAMIEMGTGVTNKVLETSGNNGDAYRVEVLSGLGQPAVVQISPYLNNKNNEIRSVAVQSLTKIISDDSTMHLCNIVKTEENETIRSIALQALEQRPATQVEVALIYVLQNDKNEKLKEVSAHILGKLKIMASLEPLEKIALRDYKDRMQLRTNGTAIIALGLLGDQRAIPTLGSLLLDCIDYKARTLAAEAISKIKSTAGFEYLISALGSDGNAEVRKASALALGQLRDRRAVEPLRLVSNSDPDSGVKEAAKSALKML